MKKTENPIFNMQPTRESFILYAAWYTCIATFSSKTQALALKAICEYALFNIPIPKVGFSRTEYAALNTFIPILDSNKKKYESGKKGAMHGIKGGRPRKNETPMGLLNKTPLGMDNKTPNDNINDKINNIDDDNGCPAQQHQPSFMLLCEELIPIFFFKNYDAKREVKRFYEHYSKLSWRLSGGASLTTRENRVMAAQWWKAEDTKPYFPPMFLRVWEILYKDVPDDLKKDFLDVRPTSRQQYGITLVCSELLFTWLNIPDINERVMQIFYTNISQSYKLDLIPRKGGN